MEGENLKLAIQTLPYDIILMILKYTSIPDIVNFGGTCKQFNEFVKSSLVLWKNALRNTVNETVIEEIGKNSDGNWYNGVRMYYSLQSEIHTRLIAMAGYFYKYDKEIPLDDVRQFFNNAFSDGFIYYCTINILQDLVKKGEKNMYLQIAKKPFTLTETYYAKVTVRHLMHSYLAIKWTQGFQKQELPPEVVLNIFLQWINPLKMYSDEEVSIAINSVAKLVEKELKKDHPSSSPSIQEMRAKGEITELQIIAAVSHVMYVVKRMTLSPDANLETLDIKKVIDMGCGHKIATATIYRAVAKKLGVQCELIAFPNHLFLELRSTEPGNQKVYIIALDSGKFAPKTSCPFSRNMEMEKNYSYCPMSLIQFVISTFLMSVGYFKTWFIQNAIHLLDFLNTNPNGIDNYTEYLPYLMENTHLSELATPINVRCLTMDHLRIIALLSYRTKIHGGLKTNELVPKKRSKDMKYAIGMIVQHKEREDVCVIRDWEPTRKAEVQPARSNAPRPNAPRIFRTCQPYYCVVVNNQPENYIAQEHLVHVAHPTRQRNLEDIVAKDFTHFNGFAYEPNSYKLLEYPEDKAVSEQYRSQAGMMSEPGPT